MDMDIASGSELTVETQNLKNPESIETAAEVIITTLMKYTRDSQFYKIDMASAASNFQASAGILDSLLMIAISNAVTPDYSTNANNQQYEIEFTTNHAVYTGGFIKLILPDSFTMSSESSAVALF